MATQLWTPGRSLHQLAKDQPDDVALIYAGEDGRDVCLTRLELEKFSNRLAHRLVEQRVTQGTFVAIVLPNCVEHVLATLATYKLGACPMPVNVGMPAAERDTLLELADPSAIFADSPELAGISRAEMAQLEKYPDTPLPDVTPQPAKAIASGGATGKPKLVVSPGAFAFPRGGHPLAPLLQLKPADLLYSPGPLFHNQAFMFTQINLFQGGRALINERFRADSALDLIEKYRPDVLNVVPTMMQRMLRVSDVEKRDLSSVRALWHMAAPCPDWAKEGWIDLLGADKVWELWGATEITGLTTISGEEWLTHRGSVGRGFMTEIRILDNHGQPCPTGEVGEIYTRFAGGPPQYSYLGAEPLPVIEDGFCSVGDMGYLDEDQYLYLSDRRVDMIISGGSNIFPAEVEAVLSSHPSVKDVAVVGIRDADLGRSVHAIIQPMDIASPPSENELNALCAESLSRYKTPRSYEFLATLPRNEAGKIRRSALRDERDG